MAQYALYSKFKNIEFSQMRGHALKAQDLIVALKLAVSSASTRLTYADLSLKLGLPASALHASVQMLKQARLITGSFRDGINVQRRSLLELIIYGVPYFFPAMIGGPSRGMQTGLVPLDTDKLFIDEEAYVWPTPHGTVRGRSLQPLHPCALMACAQDAKLYKLLMCIDVLRTEGAREREFASKILQQLL
jgi:hypothetical protein